jgi:Protein of unknown function (DUF2797)
VPGGNKPQSSRLPLGADLALTLGADRRCVGVWRAGHRSACPFAAPVEPAARTAQCASCAALDRSSSIAADTLLGDPRRFAVYLAHHGNAIKVGITAAERGTSRLLEQGALASVIISAGTLVSARRTEHLLTAALGIPDRVATARKRAARACPGTRAGRAADLIAAAGQAQQLSWPEGQTRCEPQVSDHIADYGLPEGGLHPAAEVLPLARACTIAGMVACRVGTDLYLDTADGLVLLDTRLLVGWALGRAEPGTAFTARLQALQPQGLDHDVLF